VSELDRFRGCLLGLAVGDAVGTTVEFAPRGSFPPVIDMVGGGPFRLEPGQFTDDTSMALCLAASLVESGGFDPVDQMERYCRWQWHGYLSSNGRCFDIGTTVARALDRYRQSGNPFAGSVDPWSAGNGCIMRLAPIPIFYFPDIARAREFAAESSRVTHGADECVDACRLFAGMIVRALAGGAKESVLFDDGGFELAPAVAAIARGNYGNLNESAIRGTGYVVDCLQAALWCFWTTTTFEEAVLRAANLGEDADTTAAVCGQLAGAFYGERAIPARWLETLAMRDEIVRLAAQLRAAGEAG
jgi:ADP-ribosyl-[dinitrogen reductase] hydrolase